MAATLTGLAALPAQAADACTSRSLTIVAHQDDDLLFMNPDIQHDLDAGACVTTVFLTAGDVGMPTSYWQEREAGPRAAYAHMLGLAPETAWQLQNRTYAGRSVATAALAGGRSAFIYLRLPDGGIQGNGTAGTGNQSLMRLWTGAIPSISAVDASQTYTLPQLIETLAAVVSQVQPQVIRTQDARPEQNNHSDHTAGSTIALQALFGFTGEVRSYQDYGVVSQAPNVADADLVRKIETLRSYAAHDPELCNSGDGCPSGVVADWAERQYRAPLVADVLPVVGPAPYNGPDLARNAKVQASTHATGQEAVRAIDGVVGGYPGSGGAEWVSLGQRAGAWIALNWSAGQLIDRVHLHDRPNSADQVTGGTLRFSDGSTVEVPALNNDGTSTVVTFTPRTVTSVRFTATAVSSTTQNVGLAEFEVYHGDPSPVEDSGPTPVAGPAPYAGPNVARNATIAASSEAAGQGATRAIDSIISGWPANGLAEWSSDGQRAGAWIELHWPAGQPIDRVHLYDRPNPADHVQGGTLRFSDGSIVTVSALNNDGSTTVVMFPARTVTSVRFTVTSTSSTTQNVGLAEFEAYNGDPVPAPDPDPDPEPTPEPTPVPGPAQYSGPNTARNASVAASSQAPGQAATAAIDAVIAGWPANGGAEWSSNGQRSGAWIALSWAVPQQVDRVRLYDRPNPADHIQGGTLRFSDGSTVAVPALNNDGSATLITFPARNTTSLRFTVDSTSSATENAGLAELEVYHGDPAAVPQPGTEPVAGPAPYNGPNLARNARISASTQAAGQPITAAIDAVIAGWPANAGAEWSSNGQRAGAWAELSWSSARQVDRVRLFDRPNPVDHIQGGTLLFSDGSSVDVPALNNDGSATIVTFPARATTTLRFTVRTTSSATENAGLAEFEAYDGDPTAPPPPPPPPAPEPTPTAGPDPYSGPNVARNANIMASSQATGQGATRAIDAVISGWPANGTAEWSSNGERAGAWLDLSWSAAVQVDRIYLYDRPNPADRVTGGKLRFSDGSTVAVPALNNDGSATIVAFPARSITSVRFTVDSTSSATENVGLAELEAYLGLPG
ncbi:PIG-L family deacetylase [Microbacterium sp. nov. GSS16]|uniref:PIG-L family deacetylase n=1 Tax=Microbacterium sp. nov. GSS16 TaxID=3019890 RepID=UPI00230653BA|nr:PIG-L family deacetylase [Microbacterium sp. nov. GSS16]WCD92916.1 PIG-L family deacetylase [Microbacterium sp. nov. GSS16]